MIINPIIPIWLMTIICILILVFKRKSAGSFVRQILIVLLLFVINLRFMVRDGDVPMLSPKVDVLFVVDNTISMLAEDYNDAGARRIDAVRNDCRYILENLPGATVSVWTFDNEMEIQIPYTEDVNAVNNCLAILEGPSSYHAKGTSLNIVMEKMKDVLNDDRPYYQVVFFISDGEIVSASDLKSYPGLNVFVDNGAVLGYGTEKGGKMQIRIPLIPEVNMDEENLRATLDFCLSLGEAVTSVQLLPYHELGLSKYARLGVTEGVFSSYTPDPKWVEEIRDMFVSAGVPTVIH